VVSFSIFTSTIQDLRDRYSRVEIQASMPLVAFRESVAFERMAPEQIDCPPQLSLPPWSEEEGTGGGRLARPECESLFC